jgi:hypothetical protein
MGQTVPCLDKRTKRETQNYDRDEQELVRVEEQYVVQITILTRSVSSTPVAKSFVIIWITKDILLLVCLHILNN